MWRQDDMIGSLDAPSKHPLPAIPGWDAFDARIAKPGPRNLPAAPLMHGTGAFNAMWNLALAGSVVTMVGRHFDPIELLDTIQQHQVNSHLDRRRRLRQADPARPRRRTGSLGHLVAARDRLERRHVGGRDQGRPAASQPATDHDRQPRQQRGDRHGQQHHHRRDRCRTGEDGHVLPRPQHQGAHRGRPRGAARQRRARPGGAARPHADRLLQGRGQVGRDVRDGRRRALEHPRRLGRGGGRRHAAAATAVAASASTPVARRSSPRRSRRC